MLDRKNREAPARIIMDFEHDRQLPGLLYMLERAVRLERQYYIPHSGALPADAVSDPKWLKYEKLTVHC